MATRVGVAAVLIAILFAVLYGLPAVWTAVLLSLLAALGVYEALWSTGCVKKARICAYSMVLAALIPLWFYTGANQKLALAGLFIYVFILFCEAMASKYTMTLENMGSAFFISIMVPVFLSALLRIRQGELGIYYIILPFVIAYMSDSFALFAGMLFGKHKLAPKISPKKSVEGAIGGLVGTVLFCVVTYFICDATCFRNDTLNVWIVLGCSLVLAVLGMCGDLSASVIKRNFGEKDFGNLFPGHGGVLDRIDSFLVTMPALYVMIEIGLAIAGIKG